MLLNKWIRIDKINVSQYVIPKTIKKIHWFNFKLKREINKHKWIVISGDSSKVVLKCECGQTVQAYKNLEAMFFLTYDNDDVKIMSSGFQTHPIKSKVIDL